MRWLRCSLVLMILLLSLAPGFAEENSLDERLLKEHGYGLDENALLQFFRNRTLTPKDLVEVKRLFAQLGDEEFAVRESATKRLLEKGSVVRAMLLERIDHADAEVARRVRLCLNALDSGTAPALAQAATRLLAGTQSAQATPTFLAFLPFNEHSQTEEGIHEALLKLNPKGRFHPDLVEAIRANEPTIRAAAAYVFARNGDVKQGSTALSLLNDRHATVRCFAALGLIAAGNPKGVPTLIELAGTESSIEGAWRSEEILFRLAGQKAPQASLASGTAEERQNATKIWVAWWEKNRDTVDLKRYHEANRVLGITLGIEYNTGRVWECTMDGKIRWEIKGLKGPMEAQMLRNGHVLIAESNGRRVGEWETNGNLVSETKINAEPTGCQRLPNGNTFVSTYGSVREYRPDGTLAYDWKLGGGSNAIRKHRNGNIIYVNGDTIIEKTTDGKEVRTIKLSKKSWTGIRDLAGGRFLVCSSSTGDVLEVDAKGNVLWKHKQPGSCGIARLPNGHTLISASKNVVEIDRRGKVVWSLTRPGYVRRIHRR